MWRSWGRSYRSGGETPMKHTELNHSRWTNSYSARVQQEPWLIKSLWYCEVCCRGCDAALEYKGWGEDWRRPTGICTHWPLHECLNIAGVLTHIRVKGGCITNELFQPWRQPLKRIIITQTRGAWFSFFRSKYQILWVGAWELKELSGYLCDLPVISTCNYNLLPALCRLWPSSLSPRGFVWLSNQKTTTT